MFDGKYFDWNQKRIKGIVDHYGYKFFYGKKIADLGCGYADLSGTLYRLGSEITAVDVRQDHLKVVQKKFPGIKVVRANLEGPWPFFGSKFDMILDLGLICHLSSIDDHLKSACASTTYLILETAVCDSNDPYKTVSVPEGKEAYDLAYNGSGCRPTAAYIERILSDCGMIFRRMDNAKFNSGEYKYDWISQNDNSIDIHKRRIWFAVKNNATVVTTPSNSQPAVIVQAPSDSPPNFGRPPKLYTPPVMQYASPPIHKVTAVSRPPMSSIISSNSNSFAKLDVVPTNVSELKSIKKKFAIIPGQPIPQFPDLKVLYLPLNDGPNVQQGMYDALKNVGVNLRIFDYNYHFKRHHNRSKLQSELLDAVYEFQPKLIHMQLQFTGLFDTHTLDECRRLSPGVVITNWSGDVRNHAVHEFVSIAQHTDYSLISSVGQLDMYRNAGCANIKYWQIGYDDKSNYPLYKRDFIYDVSFIGNNYGHTFPDGPLRQNVVNDMHHTFGRRLGLFGHGYHGINNGATCAYQEVNNIYNSSVCALSVSNYNNVSYYFSDRLLHCLASGRPTISWAFPGCEDYFEPNTEICFARSTREIIDFIQRCKDDPEMANRIGAAGYKRVSEEHTYTSRVLELIDMISPKPEVAEEPQEQLKEVI